MASRLIIIDRGWNRIIQNEKNIDGIFVKAGILPNELHVSREGDVLNMAKIGFWNEFGTGKIPERPFMRSSWSMSLRQLTTLAQQTYLRMSEGFASISSGMGAIGAFVEEKIQTRIKTLKFPPNKPSTIAKKGSDNPLIDTGQMRQSIAHKVFKELRE